MGSAPATPLSFADERRRFQRVNVSLLGRFMLPDRNEYPCQTRDMSPGGVTLISPVEAEVGSRVVCYLDNIGRIEGTVSRVFKDGFALALAATPRKRDKLAAQLTWLANRHELNLPEDRRHERFPPKRAFTQLVLADGSKHKCRILDVSLSGAAVSLSVRPAIGAPATVGKMKGRVVRHFEEGIAIEFAVTLQDPDMVIDNLVV